MAAITVELSDVTIERGANQNAYMCEFTVNKCEPGQKSSSFTLPSGFKGIREKSFKVHDGESTSYIFMKNLTRAVIDFCFFVGEICCGFRQAINNKFN